MGKRSDFRRFIGIRKHNKKYAKYLLFVKRQIGVITLGRILANAKPVPDITKGGVIYGSQMAMLGYDDGPEYILTDEQLGRVSHSPVTGSDLLLCAARANRKK